MHKSESYAQQFPRSKCARKRNRPRQEKNNPRIRVVDTLYILRDRWWWDGVGGGGALKNVASRVLGIVIMTQLGFLSPALPEGRGQAEHAEREEP